MYKIKEITDKYTLIEEYWDNIPVKTYRVFKRYNGGNLEMFIKYNRCNQFVDYDMLNIWMVNLLDFKGGIII